MLCEICFSRLATVPRGCPRCGQPLPLIGECRFCAEWPAFLESARSAVWLSGEARTLVHHFKYDDYPALSVTLVRAIVPRVKRPDRGVLVPVPLGARKLRLRGYNQAGLIAQELGRAWRIPVRENALRRTRDTTTQTALTPDARLANVATAFAAAPPEKDPHAILVDDVLTTGATLRVAAQALASAGWASISAVTFARALPFDVRALADR
jgi:ComF family protein